MLKCFFKGNKLRDVEHIGLYDKRLRYGCWGVKNYGHLAKRALPVSVNLEMNVMTIRCIETPLLFIYIGHILCFLTVLKQKELYPES